jgi:hypothetical protein
MWSLQSSFPAAPQPAAVTIALLIVHGGRNSFVEEATGKEASVRF